MEKQDVSQAAKKIRLLMQEKKYKEVVKIADGLSLNRINNGLLILDIVEAYEKQGNKKAAKQALLNYYDVHGITGRNMMQKLIELCIETRDISNAVGLCMEFENEWPESSISYLMRYQITASAGGKRTKRRNVKNAGDMNLQNCMIKTIKKKNVQMCVMRLSAFLVPESM